MVAMAKMLAVVLCVCVAAMSWSGAAAQLGRTELNITRSMLQEMSEVLDGEPVRFTEPVINSSVYVASLKFDMRAMGLLYNCSHLVINTITKKEAYPEGMVSVSDGHLNIKPLRQEWRPLLWHYSGPTSLVVVAVLVIAVLPLVGLFWCCWYCCRMGRRRRPFDRKYDEWVKGVLSIVLIGLLTLFLFGVVCAFATDSQVDDGGSEFSSSVRDGMNDVQAFFNTTKYWAQVLLLNHFQELQSSLNRQQQTFGMTASWKLGAFSHAASVTTLNHMVQELDGVKRKLRTVQQLTAELRLRAEELNSGLRKVKNQLLQTLARCDQPKCRALQEKYKIGQLDTEIQYSQMPDVTDLLNNVTQLLDSGIKEDMAEGQRAFNELQRSVQRSIEERMPNLSSALGGVGSKLKELSDKVTRLIDKASKRLDKYMKYVDDGERLYEEYGPYRRWAALAASVSLLLVTCALALGLLCGVCGKRPDVYGASDCCNKGAGAKCLLFGIFLIFLLGSLVTAVLVAHFVFGVAATRFVCDPLTEPRDNRLFQDVEEMVDFEMFVFDEHKDPEFTLAAAMVACHANETVYKTLHMWRFFDIKRLRAGMVAELQARVAESEPRPRSAAPVSILRAGARHKLLQLADTGLSDFDFDRILDALETNMTSLALAPLASQLDSTARSLQQPLFAAEAASLLRAAAALSALQADVLRPMLDVSARLNLTARELRDDLRFNHTSMKEAVRSMLSNIQSGTNLLNNLGGWSPQNLTTSIMGVVTNHVENFLSQVEDTLLERAARCGPLSNAFNSTRDAFCHKMLMPVNGFWISLGWCVLLLLPLLLVAHRLARLFRRAEPYPGPLVDAEYLYDAYADRDNVPLANAYAAEKRGGRGGRGAGGREPGAAGGGAAEPRRARAEPARDAAVAPPVDPYHARRYTDMAPKHWEEGPPRYLGTEYERPPPYYYPGPHDRQ